MLILNRVDNAFVKWAEDSTLSDLRERFRERVARYKDIINRKNEACSSYDLLMGYDWVYNAVLLRGQCLSIGHRLYYMRQKVKKEGIQLNLFN